MKTEIKSLHSAVLTFASRIGGVALALNTGCEAKGAGPHSVDTTTASSETGGESGGTSAAGGSGGADAQGVGSAGVESCPHPHCPETLYGKRYLRRGGMAVDDTHIYWCEGVSSEGRFISAAPKDGTGSILTIGTWYDLSSPDALVVDKQHVYWLLPEGSGVLQRANKDGSEPVSFPLPVNASGGRLDIGPLEDGGDDLFIATHGCFQVVRVPKDGGPAQLWEISDLGNGGGALCSDCKVNTSTAPTTTTSNAWTPRRARSHSLSTTKGQEVHLF